MILSGSYAWPCVNATSWYPSMVRMGCACSVIATPLADRPHCANPCFHQASAAPGVVLRIVECQAGDAGTDAPDSTLCLGSLPSTSSPSPAPDTSAGPRLPSLALPTLPPLHPKHR